MSLTTNNLAGVLQVYAQECLQQYIAAMPSVNLFTKDFSPQIMGAGQSVTTRISTTNWPSANNLRNGWASTSTTGSAVTATLALIDQDIAFDEWEFSTIGETVLKNQFLDPMVKQLANSVVVRTLDNVTSSYFTNTITVTSSSAFTVTGSAGNTTSLQYGGTLLSNLEIPTEDRYAIVSPNVYQSLVAGVLPTYVYGSDGAVKHNNIQNLLNFSIPSPYPRFYGATAPQGGEVVSGTDKLVGILGHKDGLMIALRPPVDVNYGNVYSVTVTDKTSGISLQLRIGYDFSKPLWRMAAVTLFGSAAANKNAIVPIITQSV